MNVVCIYSQALTRCAKAEAELPSLRKRVRWLICKRMTRKLHDLSLTLHPLHLSLSLSLSHLHGFHFACCFRPEWCGSFSNSLRSVARGTSFYGALVQFWNGADFQHDGRSRLFRFVTFSFFKKTKQLPVDLAAGWSEMVNR